MEKNKKEYNIELPTYTVDLQYKITFKDGRQPLYISTKKIGDISQFTAGEIVKRLENAIAEVISN